MKIIIKKHIYFFFILVTIFLMSCERTPVGNETDIVDDNKPTDGNYVLIWSDEFNGTSLNLSNWTYDRGYGDWGWGNDEWQEYTSRSQNIKIENGNLIITAQCPSNNPGKRDGSITSAKIHTKNKISFKYGKIQARIKAPYSTGMWPAFWMLGQNIDSVGWPFCGEIDIFEMFVNHSIPSFNEYTTHFNIHWADGNNNRQSYGRYKQMPDLLVNDFHIYEIVWTENTIVGKIDGIEYFYREINMWDMSEFHQDFYLIFNLAVGGLPVATPDNSTIFPQQLIVDWVRWYKKVE